MTLEQRISCKIKIWFVFYSIIINYTVDYEVSINDVIYASKNRLTAKKYYYGATIWFSNIGEVTKTVKQSKIFSKILSDQSRKLLKKYQFQENKNI